MGKPDPRAVLRKVCEHHRGDPPEVLVPAILNAIKGHGFVIIPDPAIAAAAIEYCGSTGENRCFRVRLHNSRCPVCGWTPKPDDGEDNEP